MEGLGRPITHAGLACERSVVFPSDSYQVR